MNSYLRALFGQEVSAKYLRTWHATVLAAVGLAVSGHAATSPGIRPGWPATQGGFEAAVIRLLND